MFRQRAFTTAVVSGIAASVLVVGPGPARGAATPSFVQGQTRQIGRGPSVAVPFQAVNTAGNLVVVSVVWDNTSTVTITDSRGNAFAQAILRRTWASNDSAQVFYARNVAAGANTVTATFARAIKAKATVHVLEYAGIDPSAPLDVSAMASGTGAAMTSGSATTTAAGDLLFASGASTGTITSAGSGWTSRATAAGAMAQDRLAGAAAPYAATETSSGGSWVLQLVAFKADASGAGDSTPPTVSLTAPPAGATVSGNVTVNATAADNVGVVGVTFLSDGSAIGSEDTTSPYSATWPTTSATNGSHTLTARARDAAGNATTSAPVAVTVSNAAPPGGLAAAYAFDDGAGTTAVDSSGNGLAGTLANGAGWGTGKHAGAVTLDGNDDVVDLGNPAPLRVTGSLTISAWINSDVFPVDDAAIVSKRRVIGFQLDTTIDTGPRTIGFKLTSSAGADMVRYGATTLQPATWYHVAGVYDASARTMNVYLNGQLDNGQFQGPVTSSQQDSPTGVLIGQRFDSLSPFDGRVDDVRMYTKAQSAAEVQADMANGVLGGGLGDTTPPTVSITVPAPGATVGDIVNVTANASDDQGVAGVQFLVDGVATGADDTAAPYVLTWDTRTATNGPHTLTARARDAAGNTKLSSGVNVTVANSTGFQNEILATGLPLPTDIAFLPDGRMLVTELAGQIVVLSPPYTTVSGTPFLTITNICTTCLQQGLFTLVLDPQFATNHWYYVFYTLGSPNEDRLSRFTANSTNTGTVAGSELVLWQDPQQAGPEHHGGAIAFDNAENLFFTTGEQFNAGDAQLLTTARGKLHRINKNGTIPTDNPFYDGAGPNVDSIYALGLRNPYRMSYDGVSGKLYIGDVGGNDYSVAKEELDVGAAGANYGWPNYEGPCPAPCTSPLYYYPHNGRDAAITAGFVYRGSQFPAADQGDFFFADYAQNWIRRLDLDANGNVLSAQPFEPPDGSLDGPYGDIVDLLQGPDGALYYIDLGYSDTSGTYSISKVRRIRYTASNQPPIAIAAATPASGVAPLPVAFSSAGSTDPEGQPLTYSWDFGEGGSSTAANPSHTYATAGRYTARLIVSDGVNQTVAPPITITAGTPPVPVITSPIDGTFFLAGDVITFSGTATDAEDGVLPGSAFSWQIDLLHDGHVHPGLPMTGTKSGTFTIPTSGHDFSGNVRYRFALTVTDSSGISTSTSVIIWPTKVNLSFATVPAGLTLYLDGIAKTAPFVYDTLIGFQHTIDARNQVVGSTSYTFAFWSDGGPPLHVVTVPSADASFTATYSGTTVMTTPTFVQQSAAVPQSALSTVTVVYPLAQAVGDTNVLAIGWNDATSAITSVTDTAGNTYEVAAPIARGAGLSQAIYYAPTIRASAAGMNTVTVKFNVAVWFADIRIAEYAGLGTTPFDKTSSASGTATTASSGSATTTSTTELLFGAGMTTGGFSAAGSGFTARVITNPDGDIAEDRTAAATGDYAATAPVSGSWVMQLATFKAAGQ